MSEVINVDLVLYAVRNSSGQFFRSKGYGGYGETWVSDINKAKIYTKIGQARSRVTWFANNFKEYPAPDLIKLTVGKIEVVDEGDRVKKAMDKKVREKASHEASQAKWQLERAEKEFKEAQARLNKLKR